MTDYRGEEDLHGREQFGEETLRGQFPKRQGQMYVCALSYGIRFHASRMNKLTTCPLPDTWLHCPIPRGVIPVNITSNSNLRGPFPGDKPFPS